MKRYLMIISVWDYGEYEDTCQTWFEETDNPMKVEGRFCTPERFAENLRGGTDGAMVLDREKGEVFYLTNIQY